MRSRVSQFGRGNGLAILLGLSLVALGMICTPLGYHLITAGHHTIVSFGFSVVGWTAGCALIAIGFALMVMRPNVNMKSVFLLGLTCVLCAGLLEGVLALLGYHSPYHLLQQIPGQVPWLVCDAQTGMRYVKGAYDPSWPINSEGYLSETEFDAAEAAKTEARVLILGDSFTFGHQASSYERSYAKRFERSLREACPAVVWNSAIPGIGQKQELYSLQSLFPRLRPKLVVLGFCLNDFEDNIYPIGNYYVFQDNLLVFKHRIEPDGTATVLSPEEAYRRAVRAPSRPLEYLCLSRTFYLLSSLVERLDAWKDRAWGSSPDCLHVDEQRITALKRSTTRELLRQIAQYVSERDAHLLLFVIPHPDDLGGDTVFYRDLLSNCRDFGIDFLEVRSQLTEDDYTKVGYPHWTDSGHAKAAEVLTARAKVILGCP